MSSTALSLAQLAQGFILSREAQGVSPRTTEAYSLAFHSLALALDAAKLADVRLLSSTDLERWAAALRERGLSTATRDQRIAKVKALFRWAERERFILADPAAGLRRPRKDWQPDPLSPDEVRRLLKAARTGGRAAVRDFAVVALLLDTGLRASELCALTPVDLDLRAGTVRVLRGKGGRSRVVLVGKRSREALWRWAVLRPVSSSTLFCTEQGEALTRARLRVIVRTVAQRAGIAGRCYPHRLRHTFAVSFLRAGGNTFALMHLLGHASPGVVAEYVRLAESDVSAMYRSPLDSLPTE